MAGSPTGLVADAEQRRITDIISARRHELPPGARRLDYNFDQDWAGDPAVHITLVMAKEMEGATHRVAELSGFLTSLREEIIAARATYWPFTRISVER
ncbi:MAG TPA: hypothetical protein VHW66_03310 [Stellaceae bacterium]|jgi:hypothetical protein|nr:hypothetical protein [Stellaceae bacterium]